MTFTAHELTEHVEFRVDGHRADVRLNRPRALNALDTAMCRAIHALVTQFDEDGSISEIHLSGEGRGLCAGGDVRAVRERAIAGDLDGAFEFFEVEYAMDQAIANSKTPITAHQRGIVMGGGLGISAHATHRLVYPDAQIAMPETIIGFHPDVGMMWRLAQAPGELGVHLALTGSTINAADALLVGFSDELVTGESVEPTLTDAAWMRDCYAGDDASVVIARLEQHEDPAAREAASLIRQRSPLSVWMALRGIRRSARASSLAEVFALDAVLARHALTNPDFLEGVRAQLVDKDKTPMWQHARIEDVPEADVEAMFA